MLGKSVKKRLSDLVDAIFGDKVVSPALDRTKDAIDDLGEDERDENEREKKGHEDI